MSDLWDLVVIGAGPAGLTAATLAATAGLKTLCIDKLGPGGAPINLGPLHEMADDVQGPDLAARLADAADAAGVRMAFGAVLRLSDKTPWTIETDDGERFAARFVLVATGLTPGRLGLPEEEKFEGRGLSRCAACDGPFYAGQPVVVAGATGWARQEAKELAAVAASVTVVEALADADIQEDGLRRIVGRIVGLEGRDGLESVVVERGSTRSSLPARGLFIYAGRSPAAEFAPDSLARDAIGHIVVDRDGRTSLAGLFAAGDVRGGGCERIVEAMADGERAARAIIQDAGSNERGEATCAS